ncbi:MAG: hypothetical protein WKF84_20245 [Pyrinomonadaceae bacterium]
MSSNPNVDPPQPADIPPMQPNDPMRPEPIPLPPDQEPSPRAPVREPDTPLPAGDPKPAEPTRLV